MRTGRDLKKIDIKKMLKLRKKGLSVRQIAKIVGFSHMTAWRVFNKEEYYIEKEIQKEERKKKERDEEEEKGRKRREREKEREEREKERGRREREQRRGRVKRQEGQKERRRKYWAEYSREKRKTNLKFRLDEVMGATIYKALKGQKAGRKWENLVGYTIENLMEHLEKQFDNNMIWDNYGAYWSIDHIKPKSLFKYKAPEDKEFKECWALNNLQPMEKIANIKKGNKMT